MGKFNLRDFKSVRWKTNRTSWKSFVKGKKDSMRLVDLLSIGSIQSCDDTSTTSDEETLKVIFVENFLQVYIYLALY